MDWLYKLGNSDFSTGSYKDLILEVWLFGCVALGKYDSFLRLSFLIHKINLKVTSQATVRLSEMKWKYPVSSNSLCQCQRKPPSLLTLPFGVSGWSSLSGLRAGWGHSAWEATMTFSFAHWALKGKCWHWRACLWILWFPYIPLIIEDTAISWLPTAHDGTLAREEACWALPLALCNLSAETLGSLWSLLPMLASGQGGSVHKGRSWASEEMISMGERRKLDFREGN